MKECECGNRRAVHLTDNVGITMIWVYGDMALHGQYDEMLRAYFLFFSR